MNISGVQVSLDWIAEVVEKVDNMNARAFAGRKGGA